MRDTRGHFQVYLATGSGSAELALLLIEDMLKQWYLLASLQPSSSVKSLPRRFLFLKSGMKLLKEADGS